MLIDNVKLSIEEGDMLSGVATAIGMIIIFLLLGFGVPMLKCTKPALTSFRVVFVAFIAVAMGGVLVDFSHIPDSTRDIVVRGGVIIIGGFVLVRSIEKWLSNGWLNLNRKIDVKTPGGGGVVLDTPPPQTPSVVTTCVDAKAAAVPPADAAPPADDVPPTKVETPY